MTVLEVLQSTTAYFKKHKIESPRLNAEHLLAHVAWAETDRALSGVRTAVDRNGTGAAARTGEAPRRRRAAPASARHGEFCGHIFLCDKRALVPRPETEELVELFKSEIHDPKIRALLDVGTGSGVIALSSGRAISRGEDSRRRSFR